jgi:arsenite/tail-anchored protein-transporting ATPase
VGVRSSRARRAGIEPWAWINDKVTAARPTAPLRRQRVANELREIDAVRADHATRCALVSLLREARIDVERAL